MNKLFALGFILLMIGIFVIIISLLSMGMESMKVGNLTGGFAVIIIGPIPIVIGGGSEKLMDTALILGIALTVIALTLFFMFRRMI